MNPPHPHQREGIRQALTADVLDVLVIGGGIVGAGVARDAAMRGLKTGLVEQHDFAFGTSSRSSRLLHGGLRYLAQGHISLVREASVEKKIIHHIAPHLAEPLPFIFPTYRGNRHWRLWQLKVGVKIYDLLCGGHNFGKSTWLNANEVIRKVPGLNADTLTGAVRYYDGFTNDARLTLDTLRSSANHGAALLNYCRFRDATRFDGGQSPLTPALSPSAGERENHPPSQREAATIGLGSHAEIFRGADALWICELEDRVAQKTFSVHTRAIINATGPWAGGLSHGHVKLRPTKGVHLVVERPRVPVPETVVMTEGKRILFATPWGERTILGTTDTDYAGSLDEVTADPSDINYLLGIANQFFPRANLTKHDVLSTWAGLRPLLDDPKGEPSEVSRSHEITQPEPGWWNVTGGKLTTHRLMAEQVVDQIVESLSASKALIHDASPCRTAKEPLLPPEAIAGVSGILPPEFGRRAVEHYVAGEWAVHLDDIVVRRTSWQHYFKDAAQKAEQVADWMGELLGWSASQRAAERHRLQAANAGQSSGHAAAISPSDPVAE